MAVNIARNHIQAENRRLSASEVEILLEYRTRRRIPPVSRKRDPNCTPWSRSSPNCPNASRRSAGGPAGRSVGRPRKSRGVLMFRFGSCNANCTRLRSIASSARESRPKVRSDRCRENCQLIGSLSHTGPEAGAKGNRGRMTVDRNTEPIFLTRDASRWVTELVSGEGDGCRRQSPCALASAEPVHGGGLRRGRPRVEEPAIERARFRRTGRCTGLVRASPSNDPACCLGGSACLPPAGRRGQSAARPMAIVGDELRADYRTATGEQRRVTLVDVTVQMNTQTSIAVPAQGDSADRIKLIAGEASFAVPLQSQRFLTVLAEGRSDG